MSELAFLRQLAQSNQRKTILLIMDGLGGLPMEQGGLTELEAAATPNMDRLAQEGCLGLIHPVRRGITPGSGPAHLGLFGYDPVAYPVGRGVLSALGVDIPLGRGDVAARGNFCTLNEQGLITDRRAGRIASEAAQPLVDKLAQIKVEGIETTVRLEKEYRFVLSLRGEGLHGALADTDPQVTGKAPLPATALKAEAEHTAQLVQKWVDQAHAVLKEDAPANGVILRGFASDPQLPLLRETYQMRCACVAIYPMYKGVSRLVGMDVLPTTGGMGSADQFRVVAENWDNYDFFFIHIKYTDSRGEDGNFEAKKAVIEGVDQALPILLALKPDVLAISGDHSTPAKLRGHSWHPVPTLVWAPETHLTDNATAYGERQAQLGGLGHFPAHELMPQLMAHALRLAKYGA